MQVSLHPTFSPTPAIDDYDRSRRYDCKTFQQLFSEADVLIVLCQFPAVMHLYRTVERSGATVYGGLGTVWACRATIHHGRISLQRAGSPNYEGPSVILGWASIKYNEGRRMIQLKMRMIEVRDFCVGRGDDVE